MSWDIFVQDLPEGARSVRDIPDDFEPRSLGRRAEVVRRILEVVPTAHFVDPSWGSVDGPGFSVEFDLGADDEVRSFALHVRGGQEAIGLVADLLTRCGWRAFDATAASGIFDPSRAADGLRTWKAYRDRILGTGAAG